MNLLINEILLIPSKKFKWRFSRSSGPGGQKVNTNDSRVEIIFCIKNSIVLNDNQKTKLRKNINIKLINDCIRIVVQEDRSQFKNRQIALKKMMLILKYALNKKINYRLSTKSSIASQKKRIIQKRKKGELKKSRRLNNVE